MAPTAPANAAGGTAPYPIPSGVERLWSAVPAGAGSFEQVLTYMGFALGIFPLFAVSGIFLLRKRNRSALKLPGFPFTQLIYVITGITILVLSFLERPAESSVALFIVAAGIPAYFIFRSSNKGKEIMSDYG